MDLLEAPTVLSEANHHHTRCSKNEILQQQPRPHPHAGARDECGNFGYLHDPTIIPSKQSQLRLREDIVSLKDYYEHNVCSVPFGQGTEGPGGYEALKKIKVSPPFYVHSNNNSTSGEPRQLKLLCMIYSVATDHNLQMIKAVRETWGSRCDGFLVASNVTNATLGMVDIPHLGAEEYQSMWQKVRSMWSYVYDTPQLYEEYDFFYISGDDTYVIVENLRRMIHEAYTGTVPKDPNWIPTPWRELEQWEEKFPDQPDQRPYYLGAIMHNGKHRYVCAGGAGYVLNRSALKYLIESLNTTQPNAIDPREDFFVAAGLRSQGIACSDTRDANGAWRFHHLDAEFQYNWKHPAQKALWMPESLKRNRGISARLGVDGVSEYSVSFHLTRNQQHPTSPDRLRRYHAIIYGLCNPSNDTGTLLYTS